MPDAREPRRIAALTWGVKASFRGYVAAAGGTTATAGGATADAEGAFVFPAAADSDLALAADGTLAGAGRFTGEVRFEAHGGMLKVVLADPAVAPAEGGWTLSVDVGGRRETVAKLDAAAAAPGPDGRLDLPAALTLEGYWWLGDHYPPGTVVDAVGLG